LRERYDEIRERGGDVVAIGTGNQRYAAAFVADEHIPYSVFVDDDGAAARAASLEVASFLSMFHPRTWRQTVETLRRGHRIHKAGARVTQMGGTFVIGPGNHVQYEHLDASSTDHAPLDDVIAAIRA
jgi:peroxiredoxin